MKQTYTYDLPEADMVLSNILRRTHLGCVTTLWNAACCQQREAVSEGEGSAVPAVSTVRRM